MTTDDKNAISNVTLSDEAISRINEFSSKHSDGIEDADKLQDILVDLLLRIVTYCCTGKKFKGTRKTDKIEICVVSALEGLSVCITDQDGESSECFKREIPQKEIEKQFVRLLGFRESL